MHFEPAPLDRDAGYAMLDVLQDEQTQRAALPGIEGLAPGFTDWIVTALFGGTYQRPGLGLRERQIANLAALTALGGVEPQLAGHVRTSERIGMSREEIVEVFVHLAPYVGVPKALAGLRAAAGAFQTSDASEAEKTGRAENAEAADDASPAGNPSEAAA